MDLPNNGYGGVDHRSSCSNNYGSDLNYYQLDNYRHGLSALEAAQTLVNNGTNIYNFNFGNPGQYNLNISGSGYRVTGDISNSQSSNASQERSQESQHSQPSFNAGRTRAVYAPPPNPNPNAPGLGVQASINNPNLFPHCHNNGRIFATTPPIQFGVPMAMLPPNENVPPSMTTCSAFRPVAMVSESHQSNATASNCSLCPNPNCNNNECNTAAPIQLGTSVSQPNVAHSTASHSAFRPVSIPGGHQSHATANGFNSYVPNFHGGAPFSRHIQGIQTFQSLSQGSLDNFDDLYGRNDEEFREGQYVIQNLPNPHYHHRHHEPHSLP